MKKQLISIAILFSLLLTLMSGCKKPNQESGAAAVPQDPVNPSVEQPIDQPTDDPITEEPMDTPLAVQDLTAEAAYDTGFPVKPPDEAFIKGQMDFSVEIFRRAAQKAQCKNTLIAPISISMALAMAANGAEGQTEQQLLDLLGGHSIEDLNAYYLNWRSNLLGEQKATLHIANSIWIRDQLGFEANPTFLSANAKYYDAQVFKAPFNEIGKIAINDWVKQKTDGMIPQLIGDLPPETMMILINALSFDAQWSDPYRESQVQDGFFYSIDGEKQNAKMMKSTEYGYLEGEGAIGFTRYYQGGRFVFGALLPQEGTFEDYVGSLSGEKLLELLRNVRGAQVHAQLPQFSLEYSASMKEILEEMGSSAAFSGGFGKMSNEDLSVGDVLHKTVIEVNEDGTRAAAATAVLFDKSAAPMAEIKEVTLDRPFIYFIFDRETNLPLFIGTLTSLK